MFLKEVKLEIYQYNSKKKKKKVGIGNGPFQVQFSRSPCLYRHAGGRTLEYPWGEQVTLQAQIWQLLFSYIFCCGIQTSRLQRECVPRRECFKQATGYLTAFSLFLITVLEKAEHFPQLRFKNCLT